MRSIILAAGALALVTGVLMGKGSYEHAQQLDLAASQIETEVQDLVRQKALLNELPRQAPGALMPAYAQFVNEMATMARAHHAAWDVVVKGLKDVDVQKSAVLSKISGVREICLQVRFSDLPRLANILSILDMFSDAGEIFPVVVRKIIYEKDSLVLEVSVLGP